MRRVPHHVDDTERHRRRTGVQADVLRPAASQGNHLDVTHTVDHKLKLVAVPPKAVSDSYGPDEATLYCDHGDRGILADAAVTP